MVRGRGGSFDSGSLIITTRQRSTSPFYDPLEVSRKAHRIGYTAELDAEVMSKKSRDRDRKLLNSITQRLANNNYMDRAVAEAVYECRPPAPPRRRLSSRTMDHELPMSALFIRAGSLPPRRPKVPMQYCSYDDTIDDEIEREKRINKQKKLLDEWYDIEYEPETKPRKMSMPTYAPRYRPTPHLRYTPRAVTHLPPRPLPHPSPHYHPSNAVRIELYPEIQSYSYSPKVFTHMAPIHIAERELASEPSFDEPTVVVRQSRPVVRAVPAPGRYRAAPPPRAGSVSGVRMRSSSVPPLRGAPRNHSRLADIEARIEADTYSSAPPSVSLSQLRERANQARDKLDQHKSMMDRYLPVYLGPENDVQYEVDYKYGELVNRMPELDPYRPMQGYSGGSKNSVTPYKPASVTRSNQSVYLGPHPRGNFRPQVSETRRRIRDVICSTRKDPHYFE